jgi:outer membrane receptor protein involved in Fe transport
LKSLSLIGALLLMAGAVMAQATGGRVTGTVLDRNGAALPNATVTLFNEATDRTMTTQTTESGSYLFPNVAIGDYTLTVETQSFQPARRALKVVLNQESTVDVMLEVGEVKEEVEVRAASEAQIQTDSSQLGQSFGARQILDLPSVADPNTLARLSANVVEQSVGVQGSGGSVGGTRPRGNTFNVDGVSNNDPTVSGPATRVILDAVQEFTLLNNNFNAEFGAAAGGQFNTVTKSGTNDFHGSAFLYGQSQRLNAASTSEELQFRRGEISRLPLYKQARYGGTFSGPIVPNKLFFFGALQRTFIDQAKTATSFFAPTAEGLNRLAAAPGASPFVVDLLRRYMTLAPVASPEATAAFGNLLGETGVPFGQVVLGTPSTSAETLGQVNLDHQPDINNQFRYRFNFGRLRAEQGGQGSVLFNNLSAYDTKLFSATWVRTISSVAVNDLRLSYRRVVEDYPLKDAVFNQFPNIDITALGLSLGPNPSLPQGTPINNHYQLSDALTYVRGKHNFKFGGEFRKLILGTNFTQFLRGSYSYDSLAQLLLDEVPTSSLRGMSRGRFTANSYSLAGFAQDDWKATPSLTLNVGLRYDYTSLPRDLAAQELNSVASVPGVVEFGTPETDKNNFGPRVGFAYAPQFEHPVARLVFGSEPGLSSLRGNFAVTYYEPFVNLTITSLPPQFSQLQDITSVAAELGFDPSTRPFLEPTGSECAGVLVCGVPSLLLPINTPELARQNTGSFIPDQTSPYSMSWALAYQRELPSHMVLELRYLATRGRHLPVQQRLNAGLVNTDNLVIPTFLSQPTAAQLSGLPTLGQVKAMPGTNRRRLAADFGASALTSYQFTGNSQYDAGSVSLTRRYAQGLGFTAAYTWSKMIDDSTVEQNSSNVNPRRPQDFYNMRDERALSALDIPHRFAASLNYDLPFFNHTKHGLLKTLFGGVEVNAIFQAQTGQPITVLSGRDANLNFDSVGDRTIVNLGGVAGTSSAVVPVNALGQVVPFNNNATVAYVAVNPNAQYIQAGQGARANAGRNTFRTNGFNRTDASLIKNFRFSQEKFNLQVGAEFFNLFNQRIRTIAGLAQQGVLNSTAATAFATAGNVSFNDYGTGSYQGRTIQLRAKFIF